MAWLFSEYFTPLSVGRKLNAVHLTLLGKNDYLEIGVAARIAKSDPQDSDLAVLGFDFRLNIAEGFIIVRRPVRRAIHLCGQLLRTHGKRNRSSDKKFVHHLIQGSRIQ